MVMTKAERIQKRPTTKAKRQAYTAGRVLEALEREEAQGIKHPEHLKAIHKKLKGAKA